MTADDFRAWMARHNLTRKQAGDKLGISRRTIDAYLRIADPRPITQTIENFVRCLEERNEQNRQK